MKLKYLIFTIFLIFILSMSTYKLTIITNAETQDDTFKIWILTDTHMGSYSYGYTDKYVFEDAIKNSENDWEFDWDVAFVLGDLTDKGSVTQYGELVDVFTVLTKHNS